MGPILGVWTWLVALAITLTFAVLRYVGRWWAAWGQRALVSVTLALIILSPLYGVMQDRAGWRIKLATLAVVGVVGPWSGSDWQPLSPIVSPIPPRAWANRERGSRQRSQAPSGSTRAHLTPPLPGALHYWKVVQRYLQ